MPGFDEGITKVVAFSKVQACIGSSSEFVFAICYKFDNKSIDNHVFLGKPIIINILDEAQRFFPVCRLF